LRRVAAHQAAAAVQTAINQPIIARATPTR
jgi:hypothetical protein